MVQKTKRKKMKRSKNIYTEIQKKNIKHKNTEIQNDEKLKKQNKIFFE